jgi:hypothetical protein
MSRPTAFTAREAATGPLTESTEPRRANPEGLFGSTDITDKSPTPVADVRIVSNVSDLDGGVPPGTLTEPPEGFTPPRPLLSVMSVLLGGTRG